MIDEQLLETWQIHNRIHLYLLAAVPREALTATASSKGRTVGEQFAHVHNVRLMWLKAAAPDLLAGTEKIEKEGAHDPEGLAAGLAASAAAVGSLLTRALADGGRVKGFKPHAAAFLGYLVSHESHHRGQIVLSLKQAGQPVDKKVAYGLWEWGSR
jgi:uncharacterized damage-inducible protein DinB